MKVVETDKQKGASLQQIMMYGAGVSCLRQVLPRNPKQFTVLPRGFTLHVYDTAN